MRRIYFDNAATGFPKAPGVSDAVKDFLDHNCVNLSRTFSREEETQEDFMLHLRETVAHIFHADGLVPVFSGGLTESLNTIIGGHYHRGDHVIVTPFEHNAVLRALTLYGIEFSVLESDGRGNTLFDGLSSLVTDRTKALIATAASNVTGIVTDLEAASKAAHENGLEFIIDTAQASPCRDIDFARLGASAIAFTAHKGFMGPEGVGGFIATDDFLASTRPIIAGGTGSMSDILEMPQGLPDRFEAGTMNLAGLWGFGKAVEYYLDNRDELAERTKKATRLLHGTLQDLEGIRIVGDVDLECHMPLFSITCTRGDVSRLCYGLSRLGIEARVGLHCAPLAHKALGTYPTGTLRLSAGVFTTLDDFEALRMGIKEVLNETIL